MVNIQGNATKYMSYVLSILLKERIFSKYAVSFLLLIALISHQTFRFHNLAVLYTEVEINC